MESNDEKKNKNQRFVRWQQQTIVQLGFVNNIVFLAGVGFIAFLVDLLTDADKKFQVNHNYHDFFIGGSLFLILSLLAGLALMINRLYDYRYTTQKIKKEKELIEKKMTKDEIENEFSPLKKTTQRLGKRTWFLLWIQLVSFALATILVMYYFTKSLWDKLLYN